MENAAMQPPPSVIAVPEKIIVREFAARLGKPVTAVIAELIRNGVMATQNEEIDFDTAAVIANDFGIEAQRERSADDEAPSARELVQTIAEGKLTPRPPVVVVLGHVDHGKTLLLDAIRKTHIAKGEAGGITQHIGAYQVTVPTKEEPSPSGAPTKDEPSSKLRSDGGFRTITFIDTPGHEAFKAMRSRGAKVADVAILVVAADDGIQPQTIEALRIIEKAKLPFVVAINKIDKPEANAERVKKELAELNLLPEEWGGKTNVIPVSAKEGTGIPDLLDLTLLVADVEKDTIKADPAGPVLGMVIEAHIDKGEGPVATVVIHSGTLRPGDAVVVGKAFGRIRVLKDFRGHVVSQAPPSMPVRILGLKGTPEVGDLLRPAADLAGVRKELRKVQYTRKAAPIPEEKGEMSETAGQKAVNLVLKADTLGSLEAIGAALKDLDHPEVQTVIIDQGLGNITEADILRAETSGALLWGFNVQVSRAAEEVARGKHIAIKTYRIIYELLDEVRAEMEKLLVPEVVERELGSVKILAVFRSDKASMIVGGRVLDGKIENGAYAKTLRDGREIGRGQIAQLQVQKVSTQEVLRGQECGIKYRGEPIMAVGDLLVAYRREEWQRQLAA